jgi:phage-related protein
MEKIEKTFIYALSEVSRSLQRFLRKHKLKAFTWRSCIQNLTEIVREMKEIRI